MLPTLDDVSYGFGSMLVSAMDARELSRTEMKNHLNAIGLRESQQLQLEIERQKVAAAERLQKLQRAKRDAETLATITAKDVRRWEEDDAPVSPTALDGII